MQTTVTVTATWTFIEPASPKVREDLCQLLDPLMSYKVDGAWFSPAYRTGQWDGRKRLMRRLRDQRLAFPSGLADRALLILRSRGVEFDIAYKAPSSPVAGPFSWGGPGLRDYQKEAVAAILGRPGGILRMPIRSGKTLTAAKAIQESGLRAIFIVNSDLLVDQALGVFRAAIPAARVTEWSGSEHDDTGDIVVASIQSLLLQCDTRWFAKLIKSFGIAIVDEVHHFGATGEEWRQTVMAFESRIKVGLSATIEISERKAMETDEIWMRAVCGPVVFSLETSDLIEQGHLVAPTIRFLPHGAAGISSKAPYAEMYREGVTASSERNGLIVDEAVKAARAGSRVLVDVVRLAHARALHRLLVNALGARKVNLLIGSTAKASREKALARLRAGDAPVIVSTILGEGIDIPELDVVINAGGGKSPKKTIQRMRNLTPSPGKTQAVVIELADVHSRTLADWTLARLQTYSKERAFTVIPPGS